MSWFSPLVALAAGVLTILSPCVLPLAPVLAGSAVAQHRFGPVALACGLAMSFALIGLFLATIGFSLGIDGGVLRTLGAGLMIAIGAVMVAPPLQHAFATVTRPMSAWAGAKTSGFEAKGLTDQFALGALLGAVWSPCAGPTLGSATALAAQGHDLADAALVMVAFGLGAAATLVAIGYAARAALTRNRARLHAIGELGKRVLGFALIAVGVFVLSGADRVFEAFLVDHTPQWLTRLTTGL